MVLADSDGFLNCPAEIAARKVQVHLLRGDFALAKKIIDDFAHEIRQDRGDAVVDWTHDQRLINTLANLGIHTLSQLRQRLPIRSGLFFTVFLMGWNFDFGKCPERCPNYS